MKRFLKIVCLIIGLMTLPVIGEAKVYIDIDSPTIAKFPIAITDFTNLGRRSDRENLSVWFSDKLSKSLSITNYFTIIDKSAYLEPPDKGGLTSTTINFGDWVSIGAESLVKGGFQYDGKELIGEFMLFDVVLGKLIAGKKYIGSLRDRNDMVLRFSNEILLALTGEQGVFDTKIAFIGKKGDVSDVYTINFDGSGIVKLTDMKSLTLLPQWSPDGRQIAFTSYRSGNPDLYMINAAGGRERRLTAFKGMTLAGGWAPDAKSLLVASSKGGKMEIYHFDAKDNRMRPLTGDRSINVSPSWSPDSRRIAFVSDRGGSPQIYVMDADGGNVKRLTFEGNYNTSPRWSPKGDRIVFEGSRGGNFQILIMDADGNNQVQLTAEGRNESPSWSPDGRYIVFVSTTKRSSKLCVVNSNGSNLRVLHEGMERYINPSWSPHLIFN
jgi:TolB protein